MPSNFEFEHLLHPTTLDACFHALLPATHQTNKGSHSVAVASKPPKTISFDMHLLLIIH